MKARLFPTSWLDAAPGDVTDNNKKEMPSNPSNYPTNGDYMAALELHKRLDPTGFNRRGFTLQAIAAGWHHKDSAQLKALGDLVGRDRIQVMHGRLDRMISATPHAEVLVRELGGGEVKNVVFEESGHVLFIQNREEIRKLIGEFVDRNSK